MPVYEWTIGAFFAGGLVGEVIGYFYGRRPLTPDQVDKLLSRLVNLEAMEAHERLTKVRMARNRVKTTRVDGGPNARITTMRLRPKTRRIPNDGT